MNWKIKYFDRNFVNSKDLEVNISVLSGGNEIDIEKGRFYSSLRYKVHHEVCTGGTEDLLFATLKVRVHHRVNNERIPNKPLIGGINQGYLQKAAGRTIDQGNCTNRFMGDLKVQFNCTSYYYDNASFYFELKYCRVHAMEQPIITMVSKPFYVYARPTSRKRKRDVSEEPVFENDVFFVEKPPKKRRRFSKMEEKNKLKEYKNELKKLEEILSKFKNGDARRQAISVASRSLINNVRANLELTDLEELEQEREMSDTNSVITGYSECLDEYDDFDSYFFGEDSPNPLDDDIKKINPPEEPQLPQNQVSYNNESMKNNNEFGLDFPNSMAPSPSSLPFFDDDETFLSIKDYENNVLDLPSPSLLY